MAVNKYLRKKFFLFFLNNEVEQAYRADVVDRVMLYFRITWASVLLFGSAFWLLDHEFFAENAHIVVRARIALLAFAGAVFGLSFWGPARKWFHLSPILFIGTVGTFCILQTALSSGEAYSPYIMGIFWAYAGGIFATAGIGFVSSFIAILVSIALFQLFLLVLWPADPFVALLYNAFLVGIASAFIFIAFLVERIFRHAYVSSSELQASLDEVKTLSGLLPICSCCKKIRDDKGYWNRIESYLSTHSEVNFSHGICPECVIELYPGYGLENEKD